MFASELKKYSEKFIFLWIGEKIAWKLGITSKIKAKSGILNIE